jgi:uncharacterized repeat protein (TIGR03806 family)
MRHAPTPATATLAVAALLAAAVARAAGGLDARPPNATCLAPVSPASGAGVAVQNAYPSAPTFLSPVKILQPPGDATRWFVLERAGRVRVLDVASPASPWTWLDLRDRVNDAGEGGLLGMAFHPAYPAVREAYVSYTTTGSPLRTVISRVVLDDAWHPAAPVEQVLLTVDQPYTNHNGGDIAFGPDGLLYVGLGDGGSAGDPHGYGQDTRRLLGKMLRIEVLGVPAAERYRVPADNPFAGNPRCGPAANAAACPEAWARGFRNPWRWSFDAATGALWAADVGQGDWEEIDVVERGGNYGWRCREGAADFEPGDCASEALVDPVAAYDHSAGRAVIGGVVYRGGAIPALRGQYLFADFEGGWIARLRDDGTGRLVRQQLLAGYDASAFALGNDGEAYFADYTFGRIRKLVPSGAAATDTVPANLAATGCVDPGNPALPAPGMIPYDVNAPFWSDGAAKERWLALPDGARVAVDAAGDWSLPPGAVLMKHFRIDGRLVETRLLMHHADGPWAGYTYEWNDAQTGATRVVGGKVRPMGLQAWTYPAEHECRACHTAAAGVTLGLEHAQLNREFTYPATGRRANQLDTLSAIGLFEDALPAAALLPRLPDLADATLPAAARARAYLHSSCSHCHRPGATTPVDLDLRQATALPSIGACDLTPTAGDLGIADARLVAPGNAARSVLAQRAARRDAYGMPPLGSTVTDAAGVALVNAWIDGLGGCLDGDADTADDARDNCPGLPNADQRDSDGDGHGNRCDADLDQSGWVNAADVALFRARFGTPDPHADFNGDGGVNAADAAILRTLFGAPPGR